MMIGWIMLSIPFIAFFLYVANNDGIKEALIIYLGAIVITSWFIAAAHFIRG